MRQIHHVCIQTDHYKDSLDFYTKILNFKIVKETAGFHGRNYNTWLEQDGFMIELQTNKKSEILTEASTQSKGLTHLCFLVDDVKEEVTRILSLNYTNFKLKNNEALYEVEGSYLSKVIAPEGTIIEFRDTTII
ncbi:hypothetical protein lbkm_2439 [Lachnospiraceae bacterium KM106-2]|nr:hypothetical protein lbkm_2439 [Lachnospiraceae bacterium KM106-2]